MNDQSLLNMQITEFFNMIVRNIRNPSNIGLEPGDVVFKDIESLHYNKSTESVFIEMKDKFFSLQILNNEFYHLNEFDKPINPGVETQ